MADARHNLAERLAAGRFGGRPAFLAGDERASHDQVHDSAARAASVLAAAGAARGERVLLALADSLELVWAFLGTARLGAVAVLANPALPAADHARLVADARPALVVCAPDLAGRFAGAPVLTAPELRGRLATAPPAPAAPVEPGDPAYAQYTSGTTGHPKAAVHRHSDPHVYFEAVGRGVLGLGPGDVLLSASKLYFAYGLGNTLVFALCSGAAAVLHAGRPRPAELAGLVARHQPTVLFAVPTLYANLLAALPRSPFGRLRAAVSAGEPLLPALAERVRGWLGCPVLDGLGSTEVGQTFVSNAPGAWRDGTVGRVLPPYEARVVAGDGGDPCPPGEQGRLWVRGPTVLLEYLHQPEATAAVRAPGGWLRTSDLASVDADGFVRLHGRADDLEQVGGIPVSPLEVEEVLARHAAVSEVAVVGHRDARGVTALRAVVVPTPGHASDEALTAELLALARAELAHYKVPRTVEFATALPRTPTGKLRRFLLRDQEAG